MKINLIFHDWIDPFTNESVLNKSQGAILSKIGSNVESTFSAEINLNSETEETLKELISTGFKPVFVLDKRRP